MHDLWVEFSKVAIAHFLAVASPGPDFAVVLKQSLSRGRRAALWTSVGIGAAILLHVAYSLLGIGLLIRSSALWFNLVKFAGAAYLAWLGVQALRAQPRSEASTRNAASERERKGHHPPSDRGAFALGFVTNALNPKATLFFLSLFLTLVSPLTPKLVQAGYGLWMAAATAGWFCLVSTLFTQAEVRARYLRHGHWIDRALGVVFIGFAVWLALASR